MVRNTNTVTVSLAVLFQAICEWLQLRGTMIVAEHAHILGLL
jgi:hypothetical protein